MAWCVLRSAVILLAMMVAFSEASLHYRMRYELGPQAATDGEEYIQHIRSMMNAYRDELGRSGLEAGLADNTRYRAWKRNADFINSILALPKGMNDAGR